jgi:hypothetical protein
MKITKQQLSHLIRETLNEDKKLIQLAGHRLKDMLKDLRTEYISAWDPNDWTMAGDGFSAWVDQVDRAIEYVKREVGSDLTLFDSVQLKAWDMLHMADFGGGPAMPKASDAGIPELDDEFASYLDSLEQDLDPYDDDWSEEPEPKRAPDPVKRKGNLYFPEFKE